MSRARVHDYPPFIFDERFRYGLRVGVELASRSGYGFSGGRMAAWERESVVRDLWGADEADEARAPVHVHHYDQCEVTNHNGLSADDVRALLRDVLGELSRNAA